MQDCAAEALARYDALAGDCARMLEAAQRGDWVAVADVEAGTRHRIADIRTRAASVPLDAPAVRHKFRILRKILLIDAQIRRLADPGADRLDALLDRACPALVARRPAAERRNQS